MTSTGTPSSRRAGTGATVLICALLVMLLPPPQSPVFADVMSTDRPSAREAESSRPTSSAREGHDDLPSSDRGSTPSHGTDRRPTEAEVDAAVDAARRDGWVRVIVGLRVDVVPEGELSGQQRSRQRASITAAREDLDRDLDGPGYRRVRTYETVPYVTVELTEQSVERLRRSDRAASVTVDEPIPLALADSSPLVQADQMWAEGLTGAGFMVAVLDTGVDADHGFFGDRVIEEACFSTTSQSAETTSVCPNGQESQFGPGTGAECTGSDECWHGTHVAGIAAGSGGSFSGIARGADIMSVQVFSLHDDGSLRAFQSDLIAALEHVYDMRTSHDIAAANMSLGGGEATSPCDSSPLKATIDNLRSVDIATVVASGNNSWTDAMAHPACVSSAIAVGSTTKDDAVSSFSNGHTWMIDLLAPGEAITSAVPGGGFASSGGTSMAAPHVAGAWALLRNHSDAASVDEILAHLQATGLRVTDMRSGAGYTHPRIRVHDAAFGIEPVASLDEGFETVPPLGWVRRNLSEPGGETGWFRGNSAVFDAHAGAPDTYVAANFLNASGTGTISNWLITPLLNLDDGGVVGFATRAVSGSEFPDRMEVRVSTEGSCIVGGVADDIGDFTTLLTTINPGLDQGGYPDDWTPFQITLDGIGTGREGCVAFRYHVTDAGHDGTNADYIGLDTVSYTPVDEVPPPTARITSGPSGLVGSRSATFRFTADRDDAVFQCRLDSGSWTTCTSPRSYSGLSDGSHTFRVRASAGGEVGPTASRSWTVDATPPVWPADAQLQFDISGSGYRFSWPAASDANAITYRLTRDGVLVASTTSRSATVNLSSGNTYTMRVVARDAAGNTSSALRLTVSPTSGFSDVSSGSTFATDIRWLATARITRGCNPPTNDRFCPKDPVTREQMAAFMVRALGLTDDSHPGFKDVPAGSTFDRDIRRLAKAGVTKGCNPPTNDRFCPKGEVTREQMAAFMRRAFAG